MDHVLMFHLDLNGIVMGALSLLAAGLGGLFILVSGIIALSNANNKYRKRSFDRAISFLYGSLILAGIGIIGLIIISEGHLPSAQRASLDLLALPLYIGALTGMIIFIVQRNRRLETKPLEVKKA